MKRLLLLSIVSIFLAGCTATSTPADWATVSIGKATVTARVVRSEADQARGLAGVTGLKDSEGMLFPFPKSGAQTFWMKGMLMPIDIIWISNTTVIGIEKSVPPPAVGAADAPLPLYSSPGPVATVLQGSSGFSDTNAVEYGTTLTIKTL